MKKLIFAALIAAACATNANAQQAGWIWHPKPDCSNCTAMPSTLSSSCDVNVTVKNSLQVACYECKDLEVCLNDFSPNKVYSPGNINVQVKSTGDFDLRAYRLSDFVNLILGKNFTAAGLRLRLAGGASAIGGTAQAAYTAAQGTDPGTGIGGTLAILKAAHQAAGVIQGFEVRIVGPYNFSVPDGTYSIPIFFLASLNP